MRFDSGRGVAVITLCSVLTFSNSALLSPCCERGGAKDETCALAGLAKIKHKLAP